MRLLLLGIFAASLTTAQENPLGRLPEGGSNEALRSWRWSVGSLTAASTLDVVSSWGKCCEANPLLASADSRFGARGAAIKSGVLGAQLVVQYWLVKRSPRLAKALSYANFVSAGVLTGVAVRNFGVPQPAARAPGWR